MTAVHGPPKPGATPLESALEAVICHLTEGWPSPRVAAARHLLALDEPLTINEAAQRHGGSRESSRRARLRLASALREHFAGEGLAGHPALKWLASHAPTDIDAAALALWKAGLLLDVDGLARVLQVFEAAAVGVPIRLSSDGRRVELASTSATDVSAAARRALRHGAPVPLAGLVVTLAESGLEVTFEELQAMLAETGAARLLTAAKGGFLAVAAGDDPNVYPVPRLLRRVLAVTGPLPMPSLLVAWQRQRGLGTFVPLPTDVAALRAWLGGLNGFAVDAAGVGVSQPERVPLDQTTEVLARVLSRHPEGMSRMQLLNACEAAGLAPASTAAALTYHPIISHAGWDLWALRRGPDKAGRESMLGLDDFAASPEARGQMPGSRGTRAVAYTWSAEGALVLRAVFTGSPSPVMHVPAAVQEIVAGRTFTLRIARAPADAPVSMLKVRGSNAWGFGPLLGAAGLVRHDVIEIHVDLVTGTALMRRAGERENHGDDH